MERELVQAVLANEALIALIGDDRPARVDLLDRVDDLLTRNRCRIVRVASANGEPLDLQRVMDRVVGFGQTGADRVERFFDTIALPVADERRIVLMIDDAHLLTGDFLSYLALIGPTTVGQDLRLQIVFAGTAAMWDRLPKSGNLSAERIVVRLAMEPVGRPMARPTPESVHLSTIALRPPRTPPTEGHALLRQRLVEEERLRQRRKRVTGWIFVRTASAVLLIVTGVASMVLWVRMPELRAAIRAFVAPNLVGKTDDSQALAALLERGNRLLGAGDVLGAQNVFAHAASSGSGRAATGLAKTYDPAFLAEIGARSINPDTAIAAAWYQRAVALGDREATERLTRMQGLEGK